MFHVLCMWVVSFGLAAATTYGERALMKRRVRHNDRHLIQCTLHCAVRNVHAFVQERRETSSTIALNTVSLIIFAADNDRWPLLDANNQKTSNQRVYPQTASSMSYACTLPMQAYACIYLVGLLFSERI